MDTAKQHNTIIASQQSIGGNNGGLFSGLGKALGGVFGGGGNAELQNQRVIAALGRPTATPSNVNSGAKKCANGFRNKSSVFIKIEAKKAPR